MDDQRPPSAADELEENYSFGAVDGSARTHSGTEQADRDPEPQEQVDCLIAGGVGTGKTRYLSKLAAACNVLTPGEPEMLFSHTESMAPLIVQGMQRDSLKQGLDATTNTKPYDFSIEVNIHHAKRNRPAQHLGTRNFRCMDGPGGALFYDDPSNPHLRPDMEEFRRELLRCGRSASSLVFFVDPMSEQGRAVVKGNLAHLLGDLAVRTEIPRRVPPPVHNGYRWGTPFGRPASPDSTPPTAPLPPEVAWKLEAKRVLFVFNRIDQLCMRWKTAWQASGHRNGGYSAYRIAQTFVRPADLAIKVLGVPFLQQVRAFMKPNAILAAGVCSAGGFLKNTGDPYLDKKGIPNRLAGVSAVVLESTLVLYGVREVMLFAGFERMVENIVEPITRERLLAAHER